MTTLVAFAGSELKAFKSRGACAKAVAAQNPRSQRQAGIGLAFTNFVTHTRARAPLRVSYSELLCRSNR